jgi:ATP-dependent exoDNAse (exonuclease V) alpha subunit
VKRFTKDGDIQLANGLIVPKDFGHLDYGYCVTSYGAQGATVDRLVLLETKASGRAASAEQFYVSVSRAKESVAVYTDDKAALMRAVERSSVKLAAMDIAGSSMEKSVQEGLDAVRQRSERERETAREKELHGRTL